MRLALNPKFIFRHEFFGGLFHSRKNGEIKEISHEDAIFVWAVDQLGDYELACNVLRNVFPESSYCPTMQTFLNEKLLISIDTAYPIITISDVVLEAQKKLFEAKSRRYLRSPLSVSIYPSMSCNQACDFCFISRCKKNHLVRSRTDNWLNLLKDIKFLNIPFVSILGGEPTLYEGIDRILYEIEALGLKGHITTNGLAIPDNILNLLRQLRQVTVCVSLQSLDEYHERVTGVSFRPAKDTIRRLCESGRSCQVNVVYTGQSLKQLQSLIDFCVFEGVEKLSLSVYNAIENQENFNFYKLKVLDKIIKDYLLINGFDSKINFVVEGCMLYSVYPEFDNPVETELDNLIYGCEAGQTILEILPNGQALPCILFPFDYKPSENIFEVGLSEIWHHDKLLKEIRNTKCQDRSCSRCHFGNFCNGGCPSAQLATYGKIGMAGDPRCNIRATRRKKN